MILHSTWRNDLPVGDRFVQLATPGNFDGGAIGTSELSVNFALFEYERLPGKGFPVHPVSIKLFPSEGLVVLAGKLIPIPPKELLPMLPPDWQAMCKLTPHRPAN